MWNQREDAHMTERSSFLVQIRICSEDITTNEYRRIPATSQFVTTADWLPSPSARCPAW